MSRRRPIPARRGEAASRASRVVTALLLICTTLLFGLAAPAAAVAPTVSSVTPNGGGLEAGAIVTLKGKDFTGTTAVTIGGNAATPFTVVSDTEITATVPAATAAGDAAIIVTNGTGPNTTGASYKYAAPTVTKVEPAFAAEDTSKTVVITGTGFTGATAAEVLFGDDAATAIWVVSDKKIVASTPIDVTGPPAVVVDNGVVDVTVASNSVASATSANTKFLFTPQAPAITQLDGSTSGASTSDVAIGGTLTVTGTNLWGVSKVKFGTTSVTPTSIATAGTSLDVVVPNRGNGPVEITVENAAGISTENLATRYLYYSTQAPTITSVYPGAFDASAGGTLLVTGRGLTGVTTAQVTVVCATNLTPTAATAVSDTSLILTIPANASNATGVCDLKIDNPLDNTKTTTKTDAIRYV